MSISWRGLGFLGFMIPLAFFALATMIGDGINDFTSIRISFLLSAVTVYLLGLRLNREAQEAGDEAPHQAFGLSLQNSAVISVGLFLLSFF